MSRSYSLIFLFWVLTLPAYAQSDRGIKIIGGTAPAGTERRLALVIGNKDYQHIRKLKNPINDADDMTRALTILGFEVITVTNATYPQLIAGFNRFKDKLTTTDVALLYYSGHGVSYGGKNYLLPVDVDLKCLDQVEEYGIALNRILSDIGTRQVRNSFVFLDACRNLPDLQVCDKTSRDLTGQPGLVKPGNNPRGSMIVYATREGATADDNVGGRNGLFTEALLNYLTVPNLGIRTILDKAALAVEDKSSGRQSPGRYDELRGDFVFVQTSLDTPKPTRPELATQKFLDLPFADLAFVEGGTFQMGDARSEGESDEKPVHTVTVNSFLMGKYEVTQRQWESIMGGNPSYFKDCPDCPVEKVSWDDVQVFLEKLNARTGGHYRLPTEAEWEYAAGGGNTLSRTRFGNGQNVLYPAQANFNASNASKVDYAVAGNSRNQTVKVGSFSPNGLDLYDLSGNVWEWCSDWYDTYSNNKQTDPVGPAAGTSRVLRGGCWVSPPKNCRSAHRGHMSSTQGDNSTGFRVVSQLQ